MPVNEIARQEMVKRVLERAPVTDDIRDAAWSAFFGYDDKAQFINAFQGIPIPAQTKRQLWFIKYPELYQQLPATQRNLGDPQVESFLKSGGEYVLLEPPPIVSTEKPRYEPGPYFVDLSKLNVGKPPTGHVREISEQEYAASRAARGLPPEDQGFVDRLIQMVTPSKPQPIQQPVAAPQSAPKPPVTTPSIAAPRDSAAQPSPVAMASPAQAVQQPSQQPLQTAAPLAVPAPQATPPSAPSTGARAGSESLVRAIGQTLATQSGPALFVNTLYQLSELAKNAQQTLQNLPTIVGSAVEQKINELKQTEIGKSAMEVGRAVSGGMQPVMQKAAGVARAIAEAPLAAGSVLPPEAGVPMVAPEKREQVPGNLAEVGRMAAGAMQSIADEAVKAARKITEAQLAVGTTMPPEAGAPVTFPVKKEQAKAGGSRKRPEILDAAANRLAEAGRAVADLLQPVMQKAADYARAVAEVPLSAGSPLPPEAGAPMTIPKTREQIQKELEASRVPEVSRAISDFVKPIIEKATQVARTASEAALSTGSALVPEAGAPMSIPKTLEQLQKELEASRVPQVGRSIAEFVRPIIQKAADVASKIAEAQFATGSVLPPEAGPSVSVPATREQLQRESEAAKRAFFEPVFPLSQLAGEQPGYLRGVLKGIEPMTSPAAVIGMTAAVPAMAASPAIAAALGVAGAAAGAKGAAENVAAAYQHVERGDYDKAKEALGVGTVDAVFAALMADAARRNIPRVYDSLRRTYADLVSRFGVRRGGKVELVDVPKLLPPPSEQGGGELVVRGRGPMPPEGALQEPQRVFYMPGERQPNVYEMPPVSEPAQPRQMRPVEMRPPARVEAGDVRVPSDYRTPQAAEPVMPQPTRQAVADIFEQVPEFAPPAGRRVVRVVRRGDRYEAEFLPEGEGYAEPPRVQAEPQPQPQVQVQRPEGPRVAVLERGDIAKEILGESTAPQVTGAPAVSAAEAAARQRLESNRFWDAVRTLSEEGPHGWRYLETKHGYVIMEPSGRRGVVFEDYTGQRSKADLYREAVEYARQQNEQARTAATEPPHVQESAMPSGQQAATEPPRPMDMAAGTAEPVAEAGKPMDAATAARVIYRRLKEYEKQNHPPNAVGSFRNDPAFHGMTKDEFDRGMMELKRRGLIYMAPHDHPHILPEKDRNALVDGDDGRFYVSVTDMRRDADPDQALAEPAVGILDAATLGAMRQIIGDARKHRVYVWSNDVGTFLGVYPGDRITKQGYVIRVSADPIFPVTPGAQSPVYKDESGRLMQDILDGRPVQLGRRMVAEYGLRDVTQDAGEKEYFDSLRFRNEKQQRVFQETRPSYLAENHDIVSRAGKGSRIGVSALNKAMYVDADGVYVVSAKPEYWDGSVRHVGQFDVYDGEPLSRVPRDVFSKVQERANGLIFGNVRIFPDELSANPSLDRMMRGEFWRSSKKLFEVDAAELRRLVDKYGKAIDKGYFAVYVKGGRAVVVPVGMGKAKGLDAGGAVAVNAFLPEGSTELFSIHGRALRAAAEHAADGARLEFYRNDGILAKDAYGAGAAVTGIVGIRPNGDRLLVMDVGVDDPAREREHVRKEELEPVVGSGAVSSSEPPRPQAAPEPRGVQEPPRSKEQVAPKAFGVGSSGTGARRVVIPRGMKQDVVVEFPAQGDVDLYTSYRDSVIRRDMTEEERARHSREYNAKVADLAAKHGVTEDVVREALKRYYKRVNELKESQPAYSRDAIVVRAPSFDSVLDEVRGGGKAESAPQQAAGEPEAQKMVAAGQRPRYTERDLLENGRVRRIAETIRASNLWTWEQFVDTSPVWLRAPQEWDRLRDYRSQDEWMNYFIYDTSRHYVRGVAKPVSGNRAKVLVQVFDPSVWDWVSLGVVDVDAKKETRKIGSKEIDTWEYILDGQGLDIQLYQIAFRMGAADRVGSGYERSYTTEQYIKNNVNDYEDIKRLVIYTDWNRIPPLDVPKVDIEEEIAKFEGGKSQVAEEDKVERLIEQNLLTPKARLKYILQMTGSSSKDELIERADKFLAAGARWDPFGQFRNDNYSDEPDVIYAYEQKHLRAVLIPEGNKFKGAMALIQVFDPKEWNWRTIGMINVQGRPEKGSERRYVYVVENGDKLEDALPRYAAAFIKDLGLGIDYERNESTREYLARTVDDREVEKAREEIAESSGDSVGGEEEAFLDMLAAAWDAYQKYGYAGFEWLEDLKPRLEEYWDAGKEHWLYEQLSKRVSIDPGPLAYRSLFRSLEAGERRRYVEYINRQFFELNKGEDVIPSEAEIAGSKVTDAIAKWVKGFRQYQDIKAYKNLAAIAKKDNGLYAVLVYDGNKGTFEEVGSYRKYKDALNELNETEPRQYKREDLIEYHDMRRKWVLDYERNRDIVRDLRDKIASGRHANLEYGDLVFTVNRKSIEVKQKLPSGELRTVANMNERVYNERVLGGDESLWLKEPWKVLYYLKNNGKYTLYSDRGEILEKHAADRKLVDLLNDALRERFGFQTGKFLKIIGQPPSDDVKAEQYVTLNLDDYPGDFVIGIAIEPKGGYGFVAEKVKIGRGEEVASIIQAIVSIIAFGKGRGEVNIHFVRSVEPVDVSANPVSAAAAKMLEDAIAFRQAQQVESMVTLRASRDDIDKFLAYVWKAGINKIAIVGTRSGTYALGYTHEPNSYGIALRLSDSDIASMQIPVEVNTQDFSNKMIDALVHGAIQIDAVGRVHGVGIKMHRAGHIRHGNVGEILNRIVSAKGQGQPLTSVSSMIKDMLGRAYKDIAMYVSENDAIVYKVTKYSHVGFISEKYYGGDVPEKGYFLIDAATIAAYNEERDGPLVKDGNSLRIGNIYIAPRIISKEAKPSKYLTAKYVSSSTQLARVDAESLLRVLKEYDAEAVEYPWVVLNIKWKRGFIVPAGSMYGNPPTMDRVVEVNVVAEGVDDLWLAFPMRGLFNVAKHARGSKVIALHYNSEDKVIVMTSPFSKGWIVGAAEYAKDSLDEKDRHGDKIIKNADAILAIAEEFYKNPPKVDTGEPPRPDHMPSSGEPPKSAAGASGTPSGEPSSSAPSAPSASTQKSEKRAGEAQQPVSSEPPEVISDVAAEFLRRADEMAAKPFHERMLNESPEYEASLRRIAAVINAVARSGKPQSLAKLSTVDHWRALENVLRDAAEKAAGADGGSMVEQAYAGAVLDLAPNVIGHASLGVIDKQKRSLLADVGIDSDVKLKAAIADFLAVYEQVKDKVAAPPVLRIENITIGPGGETITEAAAAAEEEEGGEEEEISSAAAKNLPATAASEVVKTAGRQPVATVVKHWPSKGRYQDAWAVKYSTSQLMRSDSSIVGAVAKALGGIEYQPQGGIHIAGYRFREEQPANLFSKFLNEGITVNEFASVLKRSYYRPVVSAKAARVLMQEGLAGHLRFRPVYHIVQDVERTVYGDKYLYTRVVFPKKLHAAEKAVLELFALVFGGYQQRATNDYAFIFDAGEDAKKNGVDADRFIDIVKSGYVRKEDVAYAAAIAIAQDNEKSAARLIDALASQIRSPIERADAPEAAGDRKARVVATIEGKRVRKTVIQSCGPDGSSLDVAPYKEKYPQLYDFQLQGVAAAIRSMDQYGGFLLMDGAGAGKTSQIMAVAKHYLDQGKKVVLISRADALKIRKEKGVPKLSGSYDEWANKLGVPVVVVDSPQDVPSELQPGKLYVGKYSHYSAEKKYPVDKDTILILDEAHALKNADSNATLTALPNINDAGAVMYATATPIDQPQHIHYLRRIDIYEGRDPDTALTMLGLVRRERIVQIKGTNQSRKIVEWAINPTIPPAEIAARMDSLFWRLGERGMVMRRELSFEGMNVTMQHVKLPPEAEETMNKIEEAFNTQGRASGLTMAQVMMHQRRQLEPYKIPHVVEVALKELGADRSVIIFASRINRSEVALKSKAYDRRTGEVVEYREVIHASEGTTDTLKQALIASGVKPEHIVEVHGNAEGTQAESVRLFQSGKARVMIATVESGGTGINLDDVKGDRPRTMIVMTAPFDAVSNIQALCRVWRVTTESYPNVYYVRGDHPIDDWNFDIIIRKMRYLRAAVKDEVRRIDVGEAKTKSITDVAYAADMAKVMNELLKYRAWPYSIEDIRNLRGLKDMSPDTLNQILLKLKEAGRIMFVKPVPPKEVDPARTIYDPESAQAYRLVVPIVAGSVPAS